MHKPKEWNPEINYYADINNTIYTEKEAIKDFEEAKEDYAELQDKEFSDMIGEEGGYFLVIPSKDFSCWEAWSTGKKLSKT